MLEKQILKSILDYLEIKKIFHWRQNTGALKVQGRFIRFGEVGSPDIFIVRRGQIIGLEVKTDKGTQSDFQKEWQTNFESAGGIYHLVRSIDDVVGLKL